MSKELSEEVLGADHWHFAQQRLKTRVYRMHQRYNRAAPIEMRELLGDVITRSALDEDIHAETIEQSVTEWTFIEDDAEVRKAIAETVTESMCSQKPEAEDGQSDEVIARN